jgi:hypothetical protein
MKQIQALVVKDLRVHARRIALHIVAWLAVMRILLQVQHAWGFTQGQSLATLTINASLALLPIFAIYSAQWLIEAERAKETFAWIRTLPVSDGHIVLGKFAAMLVICLIVAVALWVATLGIDVGLTAGQLLSVWLLWWAFAGTAVFFQVLFSGRLAGGAPAALAFVAAGIGFSISRSPVAVAHVARMWNEPGAHVGIWVACVAVEACAVAATYAWFHARDSHRLVE